jgi:hypothetical protein
MQYTIPEINDGLAKIQWSDGSFTYLELTSDMTEVELDDLVHNTIPPHLRTGGDKPSFLSEGATRTAAVKPAEADPRPAWQKARETAYGSPESQLEYITENGLDAWQTRVAQIKTDNPKS